MSCILPKGSFISSLGNEIGAPFLLSLIYIYLNFGLNKSIFITRSNSVFSLRNSPRDAANCGPFHTKRLPGTQQTAFPSHSKMGRLKQCTLVPFTQNGFRGCEHSAFYCRFLQAKQPVGRRLLQFVLCNISLGRSRWHCGPFGAKRLPCGSHRGPFRAKRFGGKRGSQTRFNTK